MKESARSLRWYFGIVGILYFIGGGLAFILLGGLGLSALFSSALFGSPLSVLNTILNVVWAIGYIYFAFTLPRYLNPEKVKAVKIFLLVPFAELVLWTVYGFLTTGQVSFLTVIFSALFTWYLYANVSRLAHPPVAPSAPMATPPVAPAA